MTRWHEAVSRVSFKHWFENKPTRTTQVHTPGERGHDTIKESETSSCKSLVGEIRQEVDLWADNKGFTTESFPKGHICQEFPILGCAQTQQTDSAEISSPLPLYLIQKWIFTGSHSVLWQQGS